MKLPKDYDETVGITGDFEQIEAGGYICKVVDAKIEKSKNDKEMLVIAFDIAEGKHKDFYMRRYEQLKSNPNNNPNNPVKYPVDGVHRLVLTNQDGKCNKFFKGFITSIEESNEGYTFQTKKGEADESTLKGKLFGVIIGREQYRNVSNELRFSSKVQAIRSVQTIKDGNFEIPKDKLLEEQSSIFNEFNVSNSSDDDLPF